MTSPDLKQIAMESDVGALYKSLIAAWNARDAKAFASQFAPDGGIVGFDGSVVATAKAIETHLSEIFANHKTPAYVTSLIELRTLTETAMLLQAYSGLVPDGQTDINPALTAVQSLVATHTTGPWRIALFQNTPAQFHGRPQDLARVNDDLRQVLRSKGRS